MSGKYDDIIDLPHPEPQTHPRMPMRDRAAQFAPFAALTGHRAALAETKQPSGRLVSFLYEAPLVGAAAPPNGRRRNSASEAAGKQRKRHG